MINVTKPYLPKIEIYKKYIDKIWESAHLTNGGQFSKKLEKEIKALEEELRNEKVVIKTNT